MARLPSVQDLSRPTPQPDRTVVGYRPAQVSNVGANALVQGGGELQRVGLELERLAERERERFDTLRAEQAFNDLIAKRQDLTYGEQGFTKLNGQEALAEGSTRKWLGQYNEAAQEIEKGLANDRQKEMFRSRASVSSLQYREDIMRHLIAEQETYAQSVYQSTLDVEMGNASTRWDEPNIIKQSQLRIDNAINQEADRNNWSAEEKAAVRINTLSQLHKTVIDNALARGNVKYASTWLQEHEQEINAQTVAQVNSAMEQARKAGEEDYLRSESQRIADEITSKVPDYASQIASAEQIKNAELRDRTLTRIDQNQTRQSRIETQQDEALQQLIIDHVITKQGTVDDIPPDKWLKLPENQRTYLTKYVEDRDNGSDMTTLQKIEFYDAVSTRYGEDPGSILGWSVSELAARLPKDKIDTVIGWRQKAATPDQPVKLDITEGQKNKIIDDAADQLKIKKNATKRSLLRDRIEEDILAFKQLNQKEPNYVELETIRDRLIQEITFDKGWWSSKTRRYELQGDEDLSTIVVPDEDKERILQRIQERQPGRAVTDEQLRQIYQMENF
jgi:hypothetical protein